MRGLLRLSGVIDRVSAATGSLVSWLSLVMVLVAAFNAVVRSLGQRLSLDLSSNAYIELQWYLFSVLFLLGAAHTLQQDQHVRVDVFYGRLSPRGRAGIDLCGSLLLLLPFCAFCIAMSWPAVANSWAVRELSPDPGGLPRYPIKATILLGFGLLALQGVSQTIKHLALLRGVADEPAP